MARSSHLRDFSGTALASLIATAADGVVYAVLVTFVATSISAAHGVGISATLAAVVGGIIHFSMCRFWVFKRFEAPLGTSIPRYMAMSGSAALLHGGFTQFLSDVGAGESLGWFASKVLIYAVWTYPLSRYAVFEIRTPGDAGHSVEG